MSMSTDGDSLEDEGFTTPEIIVACGTFLIMVGIGASCERALFLKMFASRKAMKAASVGLLCQFLFMPVSSYLLTLIFNVKGYAALGFVLVGALPGGSSSNAFTLLSHGVLELSVFMTLVSTTFSFGLLPFWLFVWSKAIDELDTDDLGLGSIAFQFGLLVIPLAIGVSLNYCVPTVKHKIEKVLTILACLVYLVSFILVIMESTEVFENLSYQTFVPAMLYFPISASFGYTVTKVCSFKSAVSRTVFYEVALQNLPIALAMCLTIAQSDDELTELVAFPLFYAMAQFGFAFSFVPIFRWEKNRNTKAGIMDNDPDFLIEINMEIGDGRYENGDGVIVDDTTTGE